MLPCHRSADFSNNRVLYKSINEKNVKHEKEMITNNKPFRVTNGEIMIKGIIIKNKGKKIKTQLTIKSGQKIGIVGNSSSKKSLFLRKISGIIDHDGLDILIDDQPVNEFKRKRYQAIYLMLLNQTIYLIGMFLKI